MTESKDIKQPSANSPESSKKKGSESNKKKRPASKTTAKPTPEPSAMKEPSAVKQDSSAVRQQPAATSTEQPQQTAPVLVKGGGKGLSIFAMFLSFLALGGAGFTWYQTQVQGVNNKTSLAVGVSEIGGQVSRLGDSISRLQKEQNKAVTQEQLSTRLLESNNAIDLRMRDFKGAQDGLLEAVERINTDRQKGVNDFVLDEVSQLLKLANNSAIFSGDAVAAVNALNLADIQLKELSDPRFAVVRRKINEEIELLNGVETADIESLSARLNAISVRVPSLPLENEPPQGQRVDIVDQPGTEVVTWRSELKRMWSDIVNSVQIQRVDKAPKPLLAPQQRYFLNQNLQLNLAKAELALLQNRASVYARSLDTALVWLNDYFDLKDAEVQATIEQINGLKAETLGVKLPSVAGSYTLLQSIKGGQ